MGFLRDDYIQSRSVHYVTERDFSSPLSSADFLTQMLTDERAKR